ncbi:MAG: 1-acyl-sn-glycerol-3-phosphate acyltransferase [Puia sp.]
MFYQIVKWLTIFTRTIFFRKITFNRKDIALSTGPLLLASNHPNSFLDAIVIGSHFKRPVHFLARGDAFRKPFLHSIMTGLKMIPIYRLSEGREFLALNDETFERCHKIFSTGGIILIFSEGLCVNQWLLRHLKKGTARIALASDVTVIPVSLNYNSFKSFGKRLIVHFGDPLTAADRLSNASAAENIHRLNFLLSQRLSAGMIQSIKDPEIPRFLVSNHVAVSGLNTGIIDDLKRIQQKAEEADLKASIKSLQEPGLVATSSLVLFLNALNMIWLFPLAAVGLLLNGIFFFPVQKFVRKKTAGTVFYDSVLFGLLLLGYPVFWIIMNLLGFLLTENLIIRCILLLMPFLGYCSILWKEAILKVCNYRSNLAKLF